jgi:twitching motility protein PilT
MDVHSVSSIFSHAADAHASDVHLVTDMPVMFRVDGELRPQMQEVLTAGQTEGFARELLEKNAFDRFTREREVDIAYQLKTGLRVRVNLHFEREQVGIAARLIPEHVPELADLGLQDISDLIRSYRHGLIIVSGPTGSGKSTSLASIIQAIHIDKSVHTVTLEDPVEFVLKPNKGIIRQREYGRDFLSFPEALKRVLRQDPDVIMVGEMRDAETISTVLTLAETGHLILATLHTPNTIQAADRIVDVFPAHQQNQVRSQLALSLRMIIAQRLVLRPEGGRLALREVLINTPAVATTIRENRLVELPSVLQMGRKSGMYTFEQCAEALYKRGAITKETFDLLKTGV